MTLLNKELLMTNNKQWCRNFFLLSLLILVISACGDNYVTPPKQFLQARITVDSFGTNKFPLGRQIRISEFVDELKKHSGRKSVIQILGWVKDDDEYILHTEFGNEKMEFSFAYDLSEKGGSGQYAVLEEAIKDGESMSGLQALNFVFDI